MKNSRTSENRISFLEKELNVWKTRFTEPGHYYSPFPDLVELKAKRNKVFERRTDINLLGIDFRDEPQFHLLKELSKFYDPKLFPTDKESGSRYFFGNQFFCFSDAIFLSSLIRYWKPKRIIEIGSGYSSALMLDINERFFNNSIELKFIEPYPEDRLESLVERSDNFTITKDFVQNVEAGYFADLDEGDLLFVDSSHVSKTYSDVNHIVFNILPSLKKGVIVHFHDILFPFEYPEEWVHQQRGWNESYLIRAFLQYNNAFRIELFTSYLENKYRAWFSEHMPLCLTPHEKWPGENGEEYLLETAGQSIYLRKIV